MPPVPPICDSQSDNTCIGRENLPKYQSKQTAMMKIIDKYELQPLFLLSGYIRELNVNPSFFLIPQDIVMLCFRFYQHKQIVHLLESKSYDDLYSMAWDATEKSDYLFAEQVVDFLLNENKLTNNNNNNNNNNSHSYSYYSNDNHYYYSQMNQNKQQSIDIGRQNNNINRNVDTNNHPNQDASTSNLMAVIKYFEKDYVKSEEYFESALSIDPNCDVIMNNYAVLLLEERRFDDAQKQIVTAIERNPGCMKNHQQYAYILFTMGKYEDAAKECQLVISLDPTVESYSGYAWLLNEMGRYQESMQQYVKLIEMDDSNAIWYFWYAVLLQKCSEYKESMEYFGKCLEINPKYEVANGNYAYSLFLNGDLVNANKYISIALNMDNNHLCVHYYYALLSLKRNNVQTCVNELYLCLRMSSDSDDDDCKCSREKGCLMITRDNIHELLGSLGY